MTTPTPSDLKITLIGTGTIGLSFAALHLTHLSSPSQLTIYDPRPDLQSYITTTFPSFLSSLPALSSLDPQSLISKINLASDLPSAVRHASIIQESGPENLPFKTALWADVEKHAPNDALLWSSTSGIPASAQSEKMQDQSRLVVVHPYNPPHIMPLLEVVPGEHTSEEVVQRTMAFWNERGRAPVRLRKEVRGFVANRLAFALLREAVHLVDEGVVSVEELDRIVETSMGPRWAVAGPFKSYHAGGGAGGLRGLFKNIGGTVDACWAEMGEVRTGQGWEEGIFQEAERAYGVVDTGVRDRATRRILEVVGEEKTKEGR